MRLADFSGFNETAKVWLETFAEVYFEPEPVFSKEDLMQNIKQKNRAVVRKYNCSIPDGEQIFPIYPPNP
ncbi:MAG: hypothetical protein VKL59_18355 [Nostocaceae cyanobacterium]|nr:hypothetical protein [Nostocaceae cyanobacterium]